MICVFHITFMVVMFNAVYFINMAPTVSYEYIFKYEMCYNERTDKLYWKEIERSLRLSLYFLAGNE